MTPWYQHEGCVPGFWISVGGWLNFLWKAQPSRGIFSWGTWWSLDSKSPPELQMRMCEAHSQLQWLEGGAIYCAPTSNGLWPFGSQVLLAKSKLPNMALQMVTWHVPHRALKTSMRPLKLRYQHPTTTFTPLYKEFPLWRTQLRTFEVLDIIGFWLTFEIIFPKCI